MVRVSFFAAPAFMFAYGVVRHIDGLDGEHGPGPAWTVGHLFFLVCLLLYGVVIVGLRRRAPAERGRVAANAFAVVGLVGVAAFVRVAVVDIIVGLRAADAAEKSALSARYADEPDILPQALYDFGPLLFELGLLALLVRLAVARPRRVPWWSPVLVAAGFAAVMANLDLLPLAAALIGLGLRPAARAQHPSPASSGPAEQAATEVTSGTGHNQGPGRR